MVEKRSKLSPREEASEPRDEPRWAGADGAPTRWMLPMVASASQQHSAARARRETRGKPGGAMRQASRRSRKVLLAAKVARTIKRTTCKVAVSQAKEEGQERERAKIYNKKGRRRKQEEDDDEKARGKTTTKMPKRARSARERLEDAAARDGARGGERTAATTARVDQVRVVAVAELRARRDVARGVSHCRA